MTVFSSSDIGRHRKNNEDAFANLTIDNMNISIVCDGMGGYNAGEVASELAVCSILDYISKYKEINNRTELLDKALKYANELIYRESQRDSNKNSMGTTVVCILQENTDCYIANVGDSRCYLYRDGILKQLTKDHTYISLLMEEGLIEDDNKVDKNLLIRALGSEKDVKIDFKFLSLQPRDVFLLCTDGLTNMIDDDEIKNILQQKVSLEDKCSLLVDAANFNDGCDNITVTLFEPEVLWKI